MTSHTDNSRVGHTPGPWDCTGCMFPDDDLGGVYYRVQADGIDARAANARLIAAAPDLLEALQHAVSVIEAHVPRDALGMEGNPQDGMWPLLDEYLHHMKAAIAKATGAA